MSRPIVSMESITLSEEQRFRTVEVTYQPKVTLRLGSTAEHKYCASAVTSSRYMSCLRSNKLFTK